MGADWRDLPRDRFGDSPAMNDELAGLVLAGRKRATCGSRASYTPETIPTVGGRWVMEDGRGAPLAVIETTEVAARRFDEVDAEFARAEGEGDLSLAYWRAAHQAFFEREGSFSPDMEVICERFEVVEVLAGANVR